ncbi:putative fatty acid methyltransferase [Paraburkholderia piptadeniae]|uniref:Fatty acid methyltransferase n=1 Tax=Paraburkholderia piptadeniae TaxID=1701573 RepID=A0A1N7RYG7_9BURK|nr:cyclopropane-fatty-acyl-phospholipid synthase family protein [Paraburkholderia piptadeniae]SIT40173.1 putative fatty acid methyltransferase [Paraburkholderia piptadeniae]
MLDKVLDAKLQTWMQRVRSELDLPVRLTLWNGTHYDLGSFERPRVSLRINDVGAIGAFLDPSLDTLGEAYVREQIDIDGNVIDIVDVAYKLASLSALSAGSARFAGKLMRKFAHTKSEDKAAIQYHYDVSNDFYRLWLDSRMVYSCGYFEYGLETLDEAQEKKIDLILSKIRLRRGHTLLDIGCGWGALVIRAAQRFRTHCVGITLSERQYDLALERVREAQVADRVEIRLQDYRDVTGKFDRITSVGMFEHVGRDNLEAYFARIQSLLTDNGVAMNHGITSTDADSDDSPLGGGSFIDKYVFPAGELPHLSLAVKAMQSGGLEPLDVENLRRHYVRTLEHWTGRFEAHAQRIREMVGETKYRIWRVYLAGCAHAFAVDNVSIFQIVCQKSRQPASVIPWSRRYMCR